MVTWSHTLSSQCDLSLKKKTSVYFGPMGVRKPSLSLSEHILNLSPPGAGPRSADHAVFRKNVPERTLRGQNGIHRVGTCGTNVPTELG